MCSYTADELRAILFEVSFPLVIVVAIVCFTWYKIKMGRYMD
jgi:hypothetical protein